MPIQTNSQKMAQTAYQRIQDRKTPQQKLVKEFTSFARSFPSLIHACGLAQAVAFAEARAAKSRPHGEYLEDLAAVLSAVGYSDAATPGALACATRESTVLPYLRLSRDALAAAGWLKRYVEAAAPE